MMRRTPPVPKDTPPCPLCNGTQFRWGGLVVKEGLMFRPDGMGMFGGRRVRVRECLACNNLQLFADSQSEEDE